MRLIRECYFYCCLPDCNCIIQTFFVNSSKHSTHDTMINNDDQATVNNGGSKVNKVVSVLVLVIVCIVGVYVRTVLVLY